MRLFVYDAPPMLTAEVKKELEEKLAATRLELFDFRQQAHYYKALHGRVCERERVLKQRIQELEALLREREKELTASQRLAAALKAKLKQLAHLVFGRKSEKKGKPEKKEPEPSGGDGEGDAGAGVKKRRRGKQPGAKGYGRRRREELPTETVYHPLPEDQKQCPACDTPFIILPTTEDSEEIDIRIEVVRILHMREMAKPACSCGLVPGIVTPPVPPKLIPKGMFTVRFWAYIIVEKFLLQRPLSRVILQLATWGLVDPRSGKPGLSQGTLTAGLRRIGELLQPLYERTLAQTRAAGHWHMDETRWLVFVHLEGKTGYKWWLWVAVTTETVCYVVDPSRSSKVPKALLGGAQGILSVDRYSAYKAFVAGEDGILLAFCWTHVRRDFDRIHTTSSDPAVKSWAQAWLERIGLLFHLNEERVAVRGNPEVSAKRDGVLRDAVGRFKLEVERQRGQKKLLESQQKPLASLLDHWEGLTLFLDYPDIPMDNSEAERQLREAALGRKNYYGSGAEWSGHATAVIMTVLRTAKRNGLNPRSFLQVYLQACAENGGKPPANLDAYLPWALSDEVRKAIADLVQAEPAKPP